MTSKQQESSTRPFSCPECGKTFSTKSYLTRHFHSAHQGERFVCVKCTKSLASTQKLRQHKCALLQHRMSEYQCSKCPELLSSPRELGVHFQRLHYTGGTATNHPLPSTSVISDARMEHTGAATPQSQDHTHPSISRAPVAAVGAPSSSHPTTEVCNCRTCHRHFADRASLYRHQMTEGHRHLPSSSSHSGSGGKTTELKPRPWGEGLTPWEEEEGSGDEVTESGLGEAYDLNAPFILARDQHGDVLLTYNVPVTNSFGVDELMERARDMYQ